MLFLYSAISGLLLSVSYNYPFLWFFGLFSFVPFLYVLYLKGITSKQALAHGFLFGLTFFGGALFWFWHMLPLDRLGVESPLVGVILIFIQWALLIAFMALFVSVWAYFAQRLKLDKVQNLFLVSALWVVFEYISLWGYALLSLGGESFFSPQFSAGMLGYILAGNHNLLQLAGIGGVYLLSFVVVLVNVYLFWLFFVVGFDFKRENLVKVISIAVLVLVMYVPFGKVLNLSYKSEGSVAKVAVINTYTESTISLSAEDIENRFNTRETLVKSIKDSGESPDIVVLPEDSRFLFTLMGQNRDKEFFNELFEDKEVFVVDSSRVNDEYGDVLSRVFLYSSKIGLVSTYDKIFLTQMGEYTPYLTYGFFKLIGLDGILEKLKRNRSYTKGEELKTLKYKDLEIGALFCSEIMSPNMYSSLASSGAGLLVNLSSQSLAHGSKLLYRQTINMAKVRAVESNKYFVQASNFVPSFIIDNNGNLLKSSKWGEEAVLYGEIEIRVKGGSFYSRLFSGLNSQ
ncbi:MAG: apolipoprotein N-acyltransferase [Parcubacteria group bacterium]|nr:apolipoprotein N-acyltransferase [Parcubacteria group bacterium]